MTCQICNKESGEYSLCPECFDLMQKGEVKQCVNCKNWYKVGSVCNCIKASTTKEINEPASSATQVKEITAEAAPNTDCKTKKAKSFHPAIEKLITTLVIFIVILMVTSPLTIPVITRIYDDRKDDAGQKTSFFTILFKEPPEVWSNPDVDFSVEDERIYLGTDIRAKCNDNYNKIVVKIDLVNHSGAIYKTDYIIFQNCKNGETYQKDYRLTTDEILKTKNIRYELYKYT